MPGWSNRSYGTANDDDLNRNRPFRFESESYRRSVVATPQGWVRRVKHTTQHGVERTVEEMLIPIGGLSATVGFPTVVGAHTEPRDSGGGDGVDVLLTFSEPIEPNDVGTIRFNVGGPNNHVMISDSSLNDRVSYANNVLRFRGNQMATGDYSITGNIQRQGGSVIRSLNLDTDQLAANTNIPMVIRSNFGFTV